jgi:cephalosporin hydroxylase
VEAFLRDNDSFVANKSKDRYLVTFSPSGFLKRVR